MCRILITLLIIFSASSYGADIDNTLLKKNLDTANTQIEVLKAQVEVMKNYQDKFLSTVYWSLGGVFGIVVLLVGYNWFTNFKNQEKELQGLKDYISQELNNRKRELVSSVNEKITEKISSENRKLIIEIIHTQHKVLLLEFSDFKNRKIYANCIRRIGDIVTLNKDTPFEYRFKDAIDSLVDILELTLKEGKKYVISSSEISIIQEIFQIVGEQYYPTKNRVDVLINKIHNQG
ncbi:hypothetical protein VXR58_12760 [Acinetobacter pittii]|uniref:hypothetical protein n=1 Tax=Acinetobacter pittii TaxID=48296 RepID=UPI003A8A56D5